MAVAEITREVNGAMLGNTALELVGVVLFALGTVFVFTWLVKTPGDLASERMSTIYNAVNLPITHPIAWTTL
jgi:hypothetical protein